MPQPTLRPLLDLVFPRACLLCSRLLVEASIQSLCPSCFQQLPPIHHGCRRCGAPLRGPASEGRSKKRRDADCPFCRNRRSACTRIFAYTVYSGLSIRVTRHMKEPSCEPLARFIGDALGDWLCKHPEFAPEHYDYVVPIPQHWFRRLTHRYNQSEVLAGRIARWIDQPMRNHWLRRVRWTQKQGMKTIAERRTNVEGAFACPPRRELTGHRVLLVDDVMTSGATLDQAASALKKAGALQVDAVVFARGVNATRPPATTHSVATDA
jgi:ComF family protein